MSSGMMKAFRKTYILYCDLSISVMSLRLYRSNGAPQRSSALMLTRPRSLHRRESSFVQLNDMGSMNTAISELEWRSPSAS